MTEPFKFDVVIGNPPWQSQLTDLALQYLRENKKAEYSIMLINNELISHLLDIDDICRERIDMLVKQMSEKENVNEELKANNQIKWLQMMNNIKNRVEEIVINEYIMDISPRYQMQIIAQLNDVLFDIYKCFNIMRKR